MCIFVISRGKRLLCKDPGLCCASQLSAASLPQLLRWLSHKLCCAGTAQQTTTAASLLSYSNIPFKHSAWKPLAIPIYDYRPLNSIHQPTRPAFLARSIPPVAPPRSTARSHPNNERRSRAVSDLTDSCPTAQSCDDTKFPKQPDRSRPLFERRLGLLAWLRLGYSPGFDSEPGYSATPRNKANLGFRPRPLSLLCRRSG